MSQENSQDLIIKMAKKYGLDEDAFIDTLVKTAFRQTYGEPPSRAQILALLVIADQYQLNPFTNEIRAYPDQFRSGIIPVVGIDGWARMVNTHPEFDGMDFVQSETMERPTGAQVEAPEWIECIIYRKDRAHPIRVREYLDECYKPSQNLFQGSWQTHPKRCLRHKSFVQCARIAFSFVGIYDQDEAENILASNHSQPSAAVTPKAPGPSVDPEELESLLTGLIKRATEEGAWHAVKQYVAERFHDQPQTLEIAQKRILEAEQAQPNTAEPNQVAELESVAEQASEKVPDSVNAAQEEKVQEVPVEGAEQRDSETDEEKEKPKARKAAAKKPSTRSTKDKTEPQKVSIPEVADLSDGNDSLFF